MTKGQQKFILQYDLEYIVFPEGKMFVAYCPAFDLSTCGKTKDDALKNLKEATDIFVDEIMEHGTFQKALKELGWKEQHNNWIPPDRHEMGKIPVTLTAPRG